MLGFLQPMILLAAVAMVLMIKLLANNKAKVLAVIVLTFGGLHLLFQAYLANYKYYAEPVNPYVYAHTSTDIFKIVEGIRNISEIHPASRNMYIQVICPDGDYWPLPWYLRDFTNIGWWSEVDEKTPAAEIIIASPAVEPALIKKLYEQPPPGQRNLYLPLFDSYLQIRPGVELRGFITKELTDKLSQYNSNQFIIAGEK